MAFFDGFLDAHLARPIIDTLIFGNEKLWGGTYVM